MWITSGDNMKLEIRGMERLSIRERQVVALKETGHNNETVARRLGISSSTVATLHNRARSKGYQVVLVVEGDPLSLFDADPEEGDVE